MLFSGALHKILIGQIRIRTLEMPGFFESIGSMAVDHQHFILYLCSQVFIIILAVVFFLTNMRTYQSHLDTVTPDIQTPAAVG